MGSSLFAFLRFSRNQLPVLGFGAAVLLILILVGRVNYLLFHVLAELFSIVIAFSIFVLTWNARRFLNNGYLVFLGISFLFTGSLDLLHTLAFKGMGVFSGTGAADVDGANLATQLWLAARYLQGTSLLISLLFLRRPVRVGWVVMAYTGVTALLLATIYPLGIFPDALLDETGLTAFKVISEYVIVGLFLAAGAAIFANRSAFDPDVLLLLLAAVGFTVLSELAFVGYAVVTDLANQIGHIFKIVAFFLVYKAIIETGFLKPQVLLFRELDQREQALKQSEQRERDRAIQLEAIMDAVPAVVWIAHDTKASLITGNRASYDVLRMKSPDNLSKTPGNGPAPDHFSVFDREGRELKPEELPLQVAAATGKPIWNFEEKVVFDDGQQIHLFGSVTPLLDHHSQPAGAVGAFIDITARIRAEEALKVSEARLRRLVDANIIGILYTDESGLITQANDAFLDIVGYTREDLDAGRVSWRTMTPDKYREIDLQHIEESYRTGACTPYEKEYIRKDGVTVPILLGFAYLGRTSMPFIAFVLDLTQQKRAEAEVREYAAQLERTNRELARANDELQDFAFVASHDLQEPLRKIQAFGDRLRDQLRENLDEDQRDYFERMLNASTRMRAMINDLLSLSRVTTRGKPFEQVDLDAVAREVVSDLELSIERSGGSVTVEPLPIIDADRVQMRQLLQNLIANGLKFHPPDCAPSVRVWVEYPAEGQVSLFVQDNGIGFDTQYLDRILLPFQRLHGRGEYEGSGIGLAVCRKIAERHSGSITASSQPGQGATFIVTLPLRQSLSHDGKKTVITHKGGEAYGGEK